MEFLQYAAVQREDGDGFQGKRKRGYKGLGDDLAPARQRSQANARERDRTHSTFSVNTAFSTLRTLIPTEPKDRKLSKIETLRLASSYISHLGTQLMAGPIDQPCLRFMREVEDNELNSLNRHQVCTFCIAHKKAPRPILTKEYDCAGFEGQIFLTSPTTSPELINTDHLTNMYY